jgi:3alpha(or 20beta)-hydroxysteroid dehydrogenase
MTGTALLGKVAIVTGAARGIGLAIARKFIAEGAKVVLTDIREEGRAHAAELAEHAIFLAHDVTRPECWTEVVAATRARFGPVSVLVNNAGIASTMQPEEWSEKEYRRVVEVNQVSVFFGMRAVLETMRERGGGSIINTSSVAGLVGVPGTLAYVAAKFAVTGMTKAAALDLGKYGIRVNSIHPGTVDTPMMQATGFDPTPFLAGLPIPRAALSHELAEVYAFLASDASSYCTGASFPVDGGWTAA